MKINDKVYDFSADKNQLLIKERGISFEEIVTAIGSGAVLDVLPHHNIAKYPNQEVYVLNINNYVYLVPFVKKSETHIFLKTIFKSRKQTKQYFKETKG